MLSDAPRTSFDSTHHSDSALLQNVTGGILSSYSSPDRRLTRPLYPDLPSAYARIQGRRTASLQPVSSSRDGMCFPLSRSSSPSEREIAAPVFLGNNAVPLKNLPCRKAVSAHIVYHEVEGDYPESSAVFETSDENGDLNRRENRASSTLDEIVSQYADPPPNSI
jgi:hypothetical protein